MERIELIPISKLKWRCPFCDRWNEEDYPISERVVCLYCGGIFKTNPPNNRVGVDDQSLQSSRD